MAGLAKRTEHGGGGRGWRCVWMREPHHRPGEGPHRQAGSQDSRGTQRCSSPQLLCLNRSVGTWQGATCAHTLGFHAGHTHHRSGGLGGRCLPLCAPALCSEKSCPVMESLLAPGVCETASLALGSSLPWIPPCSGSLVAPGLSLPWVPPCSGSPSFPGFP